MAATASNWHSKHFAEIEEDEEPALFDPRGTLTRRRAPSSSSATSPLGTTPPRPSRLAISTSPQTLNASLGGRNARQASPLSVDDSSTSEEASGILSPTQHLSNVMVKQMSLDEPEPQRKLIPRGRPLQMSLEARKKSRSRSRHKEPFSAESSSSPAQEFLSNLSAREDLSASFSSLSDDSLNGVEVAEWKLGRTIGVGAFSVVKECFHLRTSEKAAVKIIRQSESLQEDLDQIMGSNFTRARNVSAPPPLAYSFTAAAEVLQSLDQHPIQESDEEERIRAFISRETLVWSKLAPHPHVLPLLGVHSQDGMTCIFMPLCAGGNLLEHIQDFSSPVPALPSINNDNENRGRNLARRSSRKYKNVSTSTVDSDMPQGLPFSSARQIFSQVAAGIAHLHEAGVTHRDIKLENILSDGENSFKIADFGLAYISPAQHFREHSEPVSLDASLYDSYLDSYEGPAGSLNYCPPEQLSSTTSITSPHVDIWALGCVLYALINGNLPFFDDFEPRLKMKILKGVWEVPPRVATGGDQGRAVLEVLKGCLEPEKNKRWDIYQVLSSGWLVKEWPEQPPAEGRPSSASSRNTAKSTASSSCRAGSRSRSRGRQLESMPYDRSRSKSNKRKSKSVSRSRSMEDLSLSNRSSMR